MPATLYLVATPIGNLEDITLRALRVLREEVRLIACEDTRQSRKLLDHYEIRTPVISYHEHNENERTAEIVEQLLGGKSTALISDAGTPLISDPGYRIVAAAIEANITVVPIPGPSAILSALIASGLPISDFRFVGFVPHRTAARRKFYEDAVDFQSTTIAYESPHRILESLADAVAVLGNERPLVIARELTKIHEEYLRGSAQHIYQTVQSRGGLKGEITLLIGPSNEPREIPDLRVEVLRLEKEEGFDRMGAIKQVAKLARLPKREVYRLVSEHDNNPPRKCRD